MITHNTDLLSLCWLSLFWQPLLWRSLCWLSIFWLSFCWVSLWRVSWRLFVLVFVFIPSLVWFLRLVANVFGHFVVSALKEFTLKFYSIVYQTMLKLKKGGTVVYRLCHCLMFIYTIKWLKSNEYDHAMCKKGITKHKTLLGS